MKKHRPRARRPREVKNTRPPPSAPARTIVLDIPRNWPDNLLAFREWVLALANKILDGISVERDGNRELETMVAMVNALPTRFQVVSKVDPALETWSFDVVYRQAAARPLLTPQT